MLALRVAGWGLAASLVMVAAGGACGQQYPNRPVRMVVSGTGGSSNFAARLIAPGLSASLGQQLVVDNRGSGAVAIEIVARAAPDGYTLLMNGSNLWLLPFMRDRVPWDPIRDFAPLSLAIMAPNMLVVHPSLPVKSARELIAHAAARPGVLNYATSGIGNSNHLAGVLFKAMAGVDMVQINYKGAAIALSDLIAGQVQVMFPTPASVMAHVRSGRLKALAVTSAQPSPLLPGLPTVAATGLPGYESVSIFGAFAPAGTPPALVARLNREIVGALSNPDVRKIFFNAGVEVVGSSPGEFSAMIKAEMSRMGKVIKDAGIREE